MPGSMTDDDNADADLKAALRVLVCLADAGIPPDVQELLIQGNPRLGIAPGALSKAVSAALKAYRGSH